jgi:hypothetical protein
MTGVPITGHSYLEIINLKLITENNTCLGHEQLGSDNENWLLTLTGNTGRKVTGSTNRNIDRIRRRNIQTEYTDGIHRRNIHTEYTDGTEYTDVIHRQNTHPN